MQRVKPQMSEEDYFRKMEDRDLTPEGDKLMPDPTPMEPPLGYKRQPTMVEHMRAMIQSERLRMEALEAGAETFEEADDFDVDSDAEPISAYEMEDIFDPPVREAASPPTTPASVGPGPTPSEPASPAPSPAPAAPTVHPT